MSNGNGEKGTLSSMFSEIGLCVHLKKKKIGSVGFRGLNFFIIILKELKVQCVIGSYLHI